MAIGDSPTIIVGHLNDEELKKSIDSLVAHVAEGTQKMVNNFNTSIDAMKNKLKELGSVKVDVNATQSSATGSGKNSPAVDASTQRTAAQKKEAAATKETALTYDQLHSVLQRIAKDNSGLKDSRTFNKEELQSYINLLRKLQAEYVRVNTQEGGGAKSDQIKRDMAELEKIIQGYQTILRNVEAINSRQGTIDIKKWVQDIGAVDDRYKKLVRWYTVLEKEDQRRIANEEKANQKRLAELDKEEKARQKMIESARKAEQKYQDTVLKNAMKNALSMPTGNIDQVNAKIREIQFLLDNLRNKGIFSQVEINRAEQALDKLREKSRDLQEQQRRTAEQPQIAQTSTKSARDSYYTFVQRYREQVVAIESRIAQEEEAIQQRRIERQRRVGEEIDKTKSKISELKAEMTRLRTEQPPNYRDYIRANENEIERLKRKIQELVQEQQRIGTEKVSTPQLVHLRQELDAAKRSYNELTSGTTGRTVAADVRAAAEATSTMNERTQAATNSVKTLTQAEYEAAQAAKHTAEFVREIAAEARRAHAAGEMFGTREWAPAFMGDKLPNGNYAQRFIYAENDERARGLTIEQQIEEVLRLQRAEYERISGVQNASNQARAQKQNTEKNKTEEVNYLKMQIASLLEVQEKEVRMVNVSTASYKELQTYLTQLQKAYKNIGGSIIKGEGTDIAREIQKVQRAMSQIQSMQSRPVSLEDVIGIKVKTLDDIAYKLKQLQSFRQGINITDPKQAEVMKRVNEEITKLNRKLNEYTANTRRANEVSNALTRSWNYMKNRLAFYFTVGASTQFVKNLIDIRSQYEMNERALGILINSAERGTQIFNELSQMALVSPYTLIELSTAAKQLTAYDIAARDVVDTTRRLADMAAAVGIPIDRLTYALGQIKAYGYLNARDARMFSNAGIPLVKQLSDYYTELEGRMVSVADVYDRIKKKTIDFNTVMSVMYKMTDEGGKFFDFQAKMADTLKVRLANLTLAWNNMLNDMGKETQGLLSSSIDFLKKLFLHWKQVDHALKQVGAIVGLRFAVMLLGNALLKMGVKPLQRFAASLTLTNIAGKRLAMVLTTMGKSLAALLMSPTTWIMVAVMWFAELASAIWNANQATEEFNKNLRDSAKTTYDELAKFLGEDVNVRMRTELDKGDISPTEASKAWENVREQIELSSRNSEEFVQHLLSIQNESERLRQGFALLDKVSAVNAALKDMDDTTIKITQDWSKWWNLWIGADGLVGNLDDYVESLKKYQEYHKSGLRDSYDKEFWKDQQDDLETLKKDVDALTDSIDKFISLKGWSGDIDKINEAYSKIIGNVVEQNQISPEKAFRLQLITEEARANAAKKALSIRIEDEKNALAKAADENAKIEIQARLNALNEEYVHFAENNGRGKVLWEEYTTWLKEQHISETREMFRGMDAEEIAKIDFSKGKWKEFAETTANKFAREHNLATDDVFTLLNNWVKNANKWSIFIPLVISSEGDKSLYDTLKEYDSQIDKADGEIDRLNKRIDKLNKKPLVQRTADEQKELARAQKERDEAQKERDEALAKGGISKKDEKEAQKDAKKSAADARKRERAAAAARRQEESELQKTLKEELSLIDKIRSTYKDLTKEGMNHADAVNLATDGYEKTVEEINKVFAKWGIEEFNPKKFAGVANPAEIMTMLSSQLERIQATGRAKPSEIKDLEVKIKSLNVDAKKYDLTKITKGLNSELDKLKDEYELAVELDANPELGGMFMDMFGIDTDALPQTFREVFDKANSLIKEDMKKLNINADDFDILRTDLTPTDGKWMGLDNESTFYQTITKWQKTLRDMFQKNMEETEKMLDDYVQKYGDYSDKIAAVEADRLLKLKKLNETYYSDEMKSLPEYLAKLNAIEKGAAREKGQIKFDEFKNSRLYIEMFENLDYVSTATLETLRKKLDDLKSEMGRLSPEQLKQVTEQFEKIDTELMSRKPFKGFAKNMKNYAKAMGKAGKDAQKEFIRAQENYDTQLGIVTLLKEQLEQKKAGHPTDELGLALIRETLEVEEEKLQKLKEELDKAEALNNQYNIMKMLFGEQANAIAKFVQAIAANLEALTELRDTLEQTFSVDFGARINGTVDSLAKFGQGLNQIVSSAQGGNVVGVVTGAVNTVVGFGDTIASVFGGGAARTKRLNREIERSQKTVRDLNNAYKELERQVDKSLGSAETKARRLAIANKEAELAELERQLALEQRKRSKDRDKDAIEDYKEKIQDLKYEIADLRETLVNELLGSDIKSAAEEFVDAWVEAWKAGETTLDAIEEKMDSMIFNLIKKAATSKIVANLLKPLYDAVDQYTTEGSEGGVALTPQEIKNLADLSKKLDVDINNALGAYYGNLKSIGAIGDTGVQLSALQQGIQGITEDQAGALEAYWNANTQQQYVHTDLLTQIRDTIIGFDLDVQTANIGQILLQLQASYQVQMSIQSILEGVLNPSGRAFNVELLS